MEALLVIEPPNIVPPSENAVGTAVILDFFMNLQIDWLQYMTCYVAKKLKYDKCDYARFLGTDRSVYI